MTGPAIVPARFGSASASTRSKPRRRAGDRRRGRIDSPVSSGDEITLFDMHTIKDGPIELPVRGDSREWLWKVGTGSGEERGIRFVVTGSAGASAPDCLPGRVRRAIETRGRSEVEQLPGGTEAPTRIEAGTAWITLYRRDGSWTKVF